MEILSSHFLLKMQTDFQFIQEDHYRNTYNGSEKKVSQRILRWSKSNDTNVDTISMNGENRWVYLEEDDPNSIIGKSYSLSPATILISR